MAYQGKASHFLQPQSSRLRFYTKGSASSNRSQWYGSSTECQREEAPRNDDRRAFAADRHLLQQHTSVRLELEARSTFARLCLAPDEKSHSPQGRQADAHLQYYRTSSASSKEASKRPDEPMPAALALSSLSRHRGRWRESYG